MGDDRTARRFGLGRLLWIPLFGLIIGLLPTTDPITETRLLRKAAVIDGLLGDLDGAVVKAAEKAGQLREPTWGELFSSWIGTPDALPEGPSDRLVIAIEAVVDRSHDGLGLTAEEWDRLTWTRESFLANPAVDLKHVVLEAASESNRNTPRVDLEINRTADGGVTAVLTPKDPDMVDAPFTVRDGTGWLDPDAFHRAKLEPPADGTWPYAASTSPLTPYSVLPPLIAIGLALVFRSALLSLLGGVLAGGIVLGWSGGIFSGLDQTRGLFWGQATNEFRWTIVLFVLFLIGMIGVITRLGGIQGIVNLMTRRSEGRRQTRIVTALMGLVIFFDDYSNSVVVGSSMRPLTDKLKIAREKLAYLVDSTAAPIAGIALFSTWIAYEVSQYQAALSIVDPEQAGKAYSIFLQTIPLRFYCIFTIGFVLANVFLSRDYGPMLAAEKRSAEEGLVIRKGARPLTSSHFATLTQHSAAEPKARNALIPIGLVVVTMVIGFWFVGGGYPAFAESGFGSLGVEGIGAILDNAYNMHVAVVAAALGSVVAMLFAIPKIGFEETLKAWGIGFSSLLFAIAILVSAWALAEACSELRAGEYLVASVGSDLPLFTQPLIFFVLACLIAFATGTSWGTMAILIPIAIPLVWHSEGLTAGSQLAGTVTLLSFGAVLEGAIFGDHCSPISDTTVLSSVAAGSDHLDHVKTQIPYAVTTMLAALLFGYLPLALGWYNAWVAIPLGLAACVGTLLVLGRPTPEPVASPSPPAAAENSE